MFRSSTFLNFERQFVSHGFKRSSPELQLQDLSHCMGITCPEQWYSIKDVDIRSAGGGALLDTYNQSLVMALQHEFPEWNWQQWRFVQNAKDYWQESRYLSQTLVFTLFKETVSILWKALRSNTIYLVQKDGTMWARNY
jgi:hypothetical protein